MSSSEKESEGVREPLSRRKLLVSPGPCGPGHTAYAHLESKKEMQVIAFKEKSYLSSLVIPIGGVPKVKQPVVVVEKTVHLAVRGGDEMRVDVALELNGEGKNIEMEAGQLVVAVTDKEIEDSMISNDTNSSHFGPWMMVNPITWQRGASGALNVPHRGDKALG
ncbi:hypothetical protein RIF29_10479 [Crotalaria pallida]|uniref:Uncharacterized protein n=1 Tax=Crotalaria pallida TaxID=3830 RepID=A0AAN9FYZ4_CROPI